MKLSLTTRLRIGFLVLVGLLLAVSVLGVGRLFQVRANFEDSNARYYRLEVDAERIRSAFVLEQAALAGAGAPSAQKVAAFERARSAATDSGRSARELASGDASIETLLARRAAAEATWQKGVAEPRLAGKLPPAAVQRRLAEEVAQPGAALVVAIQNARANNREHSQGETRKVLLLAGAGLIAALLAAILLFSGLVRSMRGPLARLVEGARKLAGGDLSTRVDADGPAEIATLGRAFNEMARALERDARERDRVERMKDDFLLTVSHELRTPVTSVKGFAELLAGQENSLSPSQREAVEAISQSAGDLSTLLDDLLDLARSDAGRLRVSTRPTAVRPLLDRVARQMRPGFAARKQKLTVSTPRGLRRIKADPERIAQVLSNLLANASKYAPEGTSVRLTAEQDGDRVAIEVADQGPGLPPEEIDHVFERFWRADSSESQLVGGSGLGLAIARSLVELHGGEISARSNPGGGASFRFTLPATKARAARAAGKRRPRTRSRS